MDIKKILESIDRVEEGMPMAPSTMPPQNNGDPVSISVNLNASGKDHVSDLLDMMKNAGMNAAAPVNQDMMPMRTDMERLRDIVDGPKALPAPEDEQMDDEPLEGYENEPDEQYSDHHTMVNDLSGGLNRKKKMYAKAQDGDNAMAVESIREHLYALLAEKKAKPDFLDLDGDGDTKEPMKKAAADKKKGVTKGRGKLMAGRGRGKLMAGRGRGKLMAGRGRGKKN